jgi:hypothetical protein
MVNPGENFRSWCKSSPPAQTDSHHTGNRSITTSPSGGRRQQPSIAAGIGVDPQLVTFGIRGADGGLEAARSLLDAPQPSAIFTAQNLITIGAAACNVARPRLPAVRLETVVQSDPRREQHTCRGPRADPVL